MMLRKSMTHQIMCVKDIGLMKDELGGKIMTDFVGLKPKCYATLLDDDKGDKKAKGTKKCVIKECLWLIIFMNA